MLPPPEDPVEAGAFDEEELVGLGDEVGDGDSLEEVLGGGGGAVLLGFLDDDEDDEVVVGFTEWEDDVEAFEELEDELVVAELELDATGVVEGTAIAGPVAVFEGVGWACAL